MAQPNEEMSLEDALGVNINEPRARNIQLPDDLSIEEAREALIRAGVHHQKIKEIIDTAKAQDEDLNGAKLIMIVANGGLDGSTPLITEANLNKVVERLKPETEVDYPRAYPKPKQPSQADHNNFVEYFKRLFADDRKAKDALDQFIREGGRVPSTQDMIQQRGGVPTLEDFETRYSTTSLYPAPEEILKALADQGLFSKDSADEILDYYRSGRYELEKDNPLRDPDRTMTPLMEANDSPLLDNESRKKARGKQSLTVVNPITAFDAETLASAYGENLQWALSSGTFDPFDLQSLAETESERAFRLLYQKEYLKDDRLRLSGKPQPPPKVEITLSDLDIPENVIKLTELAKKNFSELDATYEEALVSYSELSTLQVREIQLAAYFAGKYGDADPEAIAWGDKSDPLAVEQWREAVDQALMSTATGQNLTPRSIINDIKTRGEAAQRRMFKQTESAIMSAPLNVNINLDDPNALYQEAKRIGQSLLGRNPSNADLQHIIGVIHAQQKEQQMASARAQLDAEKARLMTELTLQEIDFENLMTSAIPDELSNPFAAADAGSMLGIIPPTASERIFNMQMAAQQGSGNITTSFNVNPAVAAESYFQSKYGKEIDVNNLRKILQDFPRLLASPVRGI